MTTLADLQQKAGANEMDMGPIRLALGDDIPQITPTPIGRLRLVTALKNKYGANYRNVGTAAQALSHFDSEMRYFSQLRKIKGVGNG